MEKFWIVGAILLAVLIMPIDKISNKSTFVVTDNLDISCTYETLASDENANKLKQLHLDEELTKPQWYNFLKRIYTNNKITFSISLINGNVTSALPADGGVVSSLYIVSDNFKAEIYPEYIILRGYNQNWFDSNLKPEWELNINRTDGSLNGIQHSIGDLKLPYFKNGDVMISLIGKCIPTKRIF